MKRFSLLINILLLFTSVASFAQNELTGTITDKKTGNPVAGASVYIEDLKIGTVTNKEGLYTLADLPKGTYIVTVHSIGYAVITESIKIHGFMYQDFSLISAAYEEQEVVVTGNSVATELDNTPQPIKEVPNSYLLQNASTNVIDAIAKVPGVSAITDGQSISKPVIRGLGYNRVVVVNDGVRQEGQQWGDEFGIEIDPNAINRAEILKGPASLVYGSDAISGVINFLPEPTLPEGQIKGNILYNYQTNNGLINTAASIAGNIKGITFGARIDNTMAHAYQNKYDGYVLNSQFSNFNWDGTLGIHRKWGFSQLHYSYFALRTGIVDGARDSATGKFLKQVLLPDSSGALTQPGEAIATHQDLVSYTPALINQTIRHYKLVWDNDIAIGNSKIIARFAWQQNRRQENNDITQPDVSNIYYYLNTVNYDLRYVSPDWNDFNFSAGINGMYQNSQNKGTLLLIPEYNLFDLGAFAIANKKIGKLNLSGGLRYDTRQFKGHDDYVDADGNQLTANDPGAIHQFTAYSSNFNGVSASLGATYQFQHGIYLKANVSKGFRAPNVAESGSNGVHDGTVVYEIGEPGLSPESSLQFDISPGIQNKDLTIEISPFINSINNYIYPKQLKSQMPGGGDSLLVNVPGYPGQSVPVFKYTQGDATLTGVEAVFDIHPSYIKWLDWYTAFSSVNAHLNNAPDSEKYLPFIPPARLRSEITVNIKKLSKTFNNSYFRFGVFYSFKQSNVYNASSIYMGLSGYEYTASRSATPAYTLFNAALGSDVMVRGHKAFSVYLSVDNIANTPYIDYMSRFKYYPVNTANGVNRVGVYNMGRNFSIKLLIPLDLKH